MTQDPRMLARDVPAIREAVFAAGRDVVETHVSTLAFEGSFVHKRKKPVRF
jgi:hypothetical protein